MLEPHLHTRQTGSFPSFSRQQASDTGRQGFWKARTCFTNTINNCGVLQGNYIAG